MCRDSGPKGTAKPRKTGGAGFLIPPPFGVWRPAENREKTDYDRDSWNWHACLSDPFQCRCRGHHYGCDE